METKPIFHETQEDDAVLAFIADGTSIDPAMAKQIRERAETITKETYRKHGLLDVATPAIRELRDG